MKIVILGAGGVGAYLGALLARSGHDVLFVDRWQEHMDAVNRRGLEVTGQESFTVSAAAVTPQDPSIWPSADLLILATKTVDTDTALHAVADMEVGCAVSVQNGLDVSEPLVAAFGKNRVAATITLISGSLAGAGAVRGFHVDRATFLGELSGPPSRHTQSLMDAFAPTGLRLVPADDMAAVRWSKLIWWIPLVVLPAAARLTWGQAYAQRDIAILFTHIQRECAAVAAAVGYQPRDYPGIEIARRLAMSFDEAVDDVLEMGRQFVAQGMATYEVAMLLDLKHGRKTEVDTTCGSIVREAHQRGLAVPYAEFAWRLIRSVEQTFSEAARNIAPG
jgi:2-dehydropantoate 2-reductase